MAHSAWPTTSDVQSRLDAAGVTLRSGVSITDTLAAVVQEVATKTRRQFVADAAATTLRYFDGSGTPEQEVDDYVTLTSVQIATWLGLDGALILSDPVAVEENLKPDTRIILYRGTVPALQGVYIDRFPQGRRNIAVTAKYGYAAAVPDDLWLSVAYEAAARLAEEALFVPGYNATLGTYTGRLKSFQEDVQESYEFASVKDQLAGWHREFRRCLMDYRKPQGLLLRKRLAAPMI